MVTAANVPVHAAAVGSEKAKAAKFHGKQRSVPYERGTSAKRAGRSSSKPASRNGTNQDVFKRFQRERDGTGENGPDAAAYAFPTENEEVGSNPDVEVKTDRSGASCEMKQSTLSHDTTAAEQQRKAQRASR
ncbi:hypothetical protein ON010_g17507 [Phytophthora cinnamomi]|nr:hypothetical protein ON010_g17507 [Phytophthora cinnamomi]